MNAEAEIRRRIEARGRITFAEFMEVALYHPGGGYYASGERVGAGGDFYTSPSVHPAFGALLSVQLYQMWELLDHPTRFTVVEPGAGNGLLCRDVLDAADGLDIRFRDALRYVCVDHRRPVGHEGGLRGAGRLVSDGLSFRGVFGCVLSNELLDAMPVHQVVMERGALREVYVALEDSGLALLSGDPSTPLLVERLELLGVTLAEGQMAEINLAMDNWVAGVSQSLERGFVLAIDYGRAAEDLYSAKERFRGTLTTYRDHLQTDRPLEHVGRQDISAQVDFTSLAAAGDRARLEALGYSTQSEFLRNLGFEDLLRRSIHGEERQSQSSVAGMRQLVRPGGLGDFKVLALGKEAGRPDLWGFRASEGPARLLERQPLPEPTARHTDLLGGRYPSAQVEFEIPWDALWPDSDAG